MKYKTDNNSLTSVLSRFQDSLLLLANCFLPGRDGGGGVRLLINLVPMLEQKTMRKGTFFQAGQCAALSSFRVRKMAF